LVKTSKFCPFVSPKSVFTKLTVCYNQVWL
jgi:hypothetical protein